jgi:hypothetical protein
MASPRSGCSWRGWLEVSNFVLFTKAENKLRIYCVVEEECGSDEIRPPLIPKAIM